MTARPALAVVGALAALALAGCTRTLDTGKLEEQAKAEIADDVGISISAVACPDDVEAKAGDTFTCTATAEDGTTATIDVVQRDGEGNVEITAPLLNIPNAETTLEQELGSSVTVDCPDSLVTVRKGDTFVCTATGEEGRERTVTITFTDDEGNITYEVG